MTAAPHTQATLTVTRHEDGTVNVQVNGWVSGYGSVSYGRYGKDVADALRQIADIFEGRQK